MLTAAGICRHDSQAEVDRRVLVALRGVARDSHVSGPLHAALPQQALQAHSTTGPVVATKVNCSQQGVMDQFQAVRPSHRASKLGGACGPRYMWTHLHSGLPKGLGWPPHLEAEGRVCRTAGKGQAARPLRLAGAPAIRQTRLEPAFHKPSPSSLKLHVSELPG